MKKSILFLLFWALLLPLMAQNFLTITGTVTDSATGAPVPNHPVTVQTDSTTPPGFFYYHEVHTFLNGIYADTIYFIDGLIPSGLLIVSTPECNFGFQIAVFQFGPGNLHFTKNFSICNSPPPCHAEFTWQPQGDLIIHFIDLSIGGNVNHSWQFGDGGTSNLKDPTHTYPQPGFYNVVLTISDSATNCFNTETKMVLVGDSIWGCHADFHAVHDSANPMNVLFFDESQGNNIMTWFWNFGDGTTSGLKDPVHLFTQPGIHHVCLTIHSSDSTCFDIRCKDIFVGNNGGCHAQFTWYPDSLNNNLLVYHFIDLSMGGGSSWYWDFGDSTYSTIKNPEHTFTHEGEYHVCLTITSSNPSCQDTWCAEVNAGNNPGCANYFTFSQNLLHVNFEGEMVNHHPADYDWSFGDGTTGHGKNTSHNYMAPGVYYVTLTTIEECTHCPFTSGQTIQVGDSGQYNQIYGQVYEGNFTLHFGIAMIFSLDGPNMLPFFAISVIDSMGIYSFPYVPQGNFVVWVIPADLSGYLPTYYGDVLNWQQATVIHLGSPSNPYNVHLIHGTSANSGPGGINGQINTGDNPNDLTDKIRMILMNEEGYSLGFVNVNSSGTFSFGQLAYGIYFLRAELPGVISDLIKVEISETKPVANVIMTYSGSQLLGIENSVSIVDNLVLYPNPVQDKINIRMNVKQDAVITVTLSDLAGRQLATSSFSLQKGLNDLKMSTSNLQQGIFILRISSSQGINIIHKLIK